MNIRSLKNSYFELLTQRKLEAASKALDDIKKVVHSTQWEKGYTNSLQGMLEASRSKSDEKFLINEINLSEINQLRGKFNRQSTNELLADFDKGFFAAWGDYLRFIEKKEIQLKINSFI